MVHCQARSILFVALATACASPAERPAIVERPAPTESRTIAPPVTSAPELPAPVPVPPPIVATLQPLARPAKIACKLTSASWKATADLSFAPGRPPFADINEGRKVEIEVGEELAGMPHILVTVDLGPIVVAGSIDGLGLRPARAFRATPYLVPRASMHAALVGAGQGTLRASMGVGHQVVPANAADLVVERPCADFGVDLASFRAGPAFDPAPPRRSMFFKNNEAALLDAPAGTKQADLTIDGDEVVSVLDEKSGHALVLWTLENVLVRGWVSKTDLAVKSNGPFARGIAGKGAGKLNGTSHSSRVVRCPADVPLVVRQADERRIVGRIKAQTAVLLFGETDEYQTVDMNQQGIWLTKGTTFEVRKTDLASCPRD